MSASVPKPPTETQGEKLDTLDQASAAFVDSGASAVEQLDTDTRTRRAQTAEQIAKDQEAELKLAERDRKAAEGGLSAHNSLTTPAPVFTEQLDRPDYNPQRRPSSKANTLSTTGESAREAAERVDAKKDMPTNAEIVQERRNASAELRAVPVTDAQSPYLGEQ